MATTAPHGVEIVGYNTLHASPMLTAYQTVNPKSSIPSFSQDDRAERLLASINSDKAKYENNPEAIIQAISDFTPQGRHNFFPIYSPAKIAISRAALEKTSPVKTIVEAGVCVGTSALGWGKMIKDFNPGDASVRVYALELDEKMCRTATELIKLAGLDDVVTVIQGTADGSIKKLKDAGELKVIDALFLDHWKDRYLPDIQLCEDWKLFRVGSVIIADNTDMPGERFRNCKGKAVEGADVKL
jgi:catechol O-methyltransferase